MDSSAIFLIIVHSAQCANILGVFTFPSLSHQIVQHSLCRELSLRGHQVTVITPTPFHDSTLTNLTEISIDFVYDIMKQRSIQTQDIGIYQKSINAFECFDSIIEIAMNSTEVLQLVGDQDRKFDLILIELMHPVLLGFGARFGAPSIGISTWPLFGYKYDAIGHLQHPVVYSDQFLTPHIKPQPFWERFGSITYFLWSKCYYQWVFVPRAQTMATKYFGQVPYIGDLEKNLSLCFLGVNSLFLSQKPKTPAMMEIGPIHIQPPKPLPEVSHHAESDLWQIKPSRIYKKFWIEQRQGSYT
jgi:glucuronosyltransferase